MGRDGFDPQRVTKETSNPIWESEEIEDFDDKTCLDSAAVLIAGLIGFAANAGKMLVVDPRPSDVIVVLAGETDHRPAHALQLLDEGYARRVLIDVPVLLKFMDLLSEVGGEVGPRPS